MSHKLSVEMLNRIIMNPSDMREELIEQGVNTKPEIEAILQRYAPGMTRDHMRCAMQYVRVAALSAFMGIQLARATYCEAMQKERADVDYDALLHAVSLVNIWLAGDIDVALGGNPVPGDSMEARLAALDALIPHIQGAAGSQFFGQLMRERMARHLAATATGAGTAGQAPLQ